MEAELSEHDRQQPIISAAVDKLVVELALPWLPTACALASAYFAETVLRSGKPLNFWNDLWGNEVPFAAVFLLWPLGGRAKKTLEQIERGWRFAAGWLAPLYVARWVVVVLPWVIVGLCAAYYLDRAVPQAFIDAAARRGILKLELWLYGVGLGIRLLIFSAERYAARASATAVAPAT